MINLLAFGRHINPFSAWEFYDIQRPELSSLRASVLIRLLIVDTPPFRELLSDAFAHDIGWELR